MKRRTRYKIEKLKRLLKTEQINVVSIPFRQKDVANDDSSADIHSSNDAETFTVDVSIAIKRAL